MTPEQEKQAQTFLDCWDGDWGLYADHVATQRQIPRAEALLFMVAMQIGSMRDEFARAQHPKFNPDCQHCVDQKHAREYMERAIKHMDECEGGDDWKP